MRARASKMPRGARRVGRRRARRPLLGALCTAVLVSALLCAAPRGAEAGKNRQRRTSSRAVSRTDRDLSTVRRTCDDQVAAAAERACGFGLSAAPPGFGLAARENCVMHCMAPPCYEEIYGADPLEDGEIDTMRGRKFRVCAKAYVKEERERRAAEKLAGGREEI